MNIARLIVLLGCSVLLVASAPLPVHAAFGDLDMTFAGFGAGGKVLTDVNGGSNAAYAVAMQPDDKIVVAGSASGALVVARYLGNGVSDSSFGGGTGYTRTPEGSSSRAYAGRPSE